MEIHVLSPDENSIDEEEYKLMGVITEQNKNNLKWYMFPNVKIDFEQVLMIKEGNSA